MTDCKQQILNTLSDNTCCSHAFLNVVVLASQISDNRSSLMLNSPNFISDKIINIISKFYPNFEFNGWENFLLIKGNIAELLTGIDFKPQIDLNFFNQECDRLTLLKSFFLFFGRFYYNQDNFENSKGYNLEFVFKDEHTAIVVISLLQEKGFELKMIKRLSNFVVYTKNSNTISDLFVVLGATYTSLDIQNTLAIREMRNNVNRQNNCFEGNLEKTLSASANQLNAINFIIDNFSIDYLPENLKEVALVRLANPDAPLNELKVLLGGNISRAGIKYRLDKIIETYNKLKENL